MKFPKVKDDAVKRWFKQHEILGKWRMMQYKNG